MQRNEARGCSSAVLPWGCCITVMIRGRTVIEDGDKVRHFTSAFLVQAAVCLMLTNLIKQTNWQTFCLRALCSHKMISVGSHLKTELWRQTFRKKKTTDLIAFVNSKLDLFVFCSILHLFHVYVFCWGKAQNLPYDRKNTEFKESRAEWKIHAQVILNELLFFNLQRDFSQQYGSTTIVYF